MDVSMNGWFFCFFLMVYLENAYHTDTYIHTNIERIYLQMGIYLEVDFVSLSLLLTFSPSKSIDISGSLGISSIFRPSLFPRHVSTGNWFVKYCTLAHI